LEFADKLFMEDAKDIKIRELEAAVVQYCFAAEAGR